MSNVYYHYIEESEFHVVGAADENPRKAILVLLSGTTNNSLFDARRVRALTCGCNVDCR